MDFIKDTIIYLFNQLNNKDQLDIQLKINEYILNLKKDKEKNMELIHEKIYEISWC